MSEWFGGRYVVFGSFILSAIFTFLSPILASFSFWYLFGIRYMIGFAGVSQGTWMKNVKTFQTAFFLLLSGCHLSRITQSRIKMGSCRRKGKIYCNFVRWKLWNSRHMGSCGYNHRSPGLGVGILHSRNIYHVPFLCLALLCCRSTWHPSSYQWERKTINWSLIRRHSINGEANLPRFQNSYFNSVLGTTFTALRQPLGTILPANSLSKIHERST